MIVVNSNDIPAPLRASPKGKYRSATKDLSIALGRDPESTDRLKQHPFDVAICSIPPGAARCPLHAHSSQWEFYHVISGFGIAREAERETRVGPGDAFHFPPGAAHQLRNDGDVDFVYLVVADNPVGDHCYYPDSGKWLVLNPERRVLRGEPLDYFDGEE